MHLAATRREDGPRAGGAIDSSHLQSYAGYDIAAKVGRRCFDSCLRSAERRAARYDRTMTELRVVVPDEIAERLAAMASERGTSTENAAAEVLRLHTPVAFDRHRPRFVGKGHSGRHDLSEHVEEILSAELGT